MNTEYVIRKYQNDQNPIAHMHEKFEVFISLSDRGSLFVKEKGYPLSYGAIFILQPFEIHRCFSHGNVEHERYILQFPKEVLERLSTKNTDLIGIFSHAPVVIVASGEQMEELLGILQKLHDESDGSFGEDVLRNLTFELFLLKIAQLAYDSKDALPVKGEEEEGSSQIDEILQYIHENYAENISLDSVAKHFYISKSRLCKIFKDHTGFSVGDYIITYRIRMACVLLRKGIHVKEVGERVGFRTSTHFIRIFKQRTGYSPGKFAKGKS